MIRSLETRNKLFKARKIALRPKKFGALPQGFFGHFCLKAAPVAAFSVRPKIPKFYTLYIQMFSTELFSNFSNHYLHSKRGSNYPHWVYPRRTQTPGGIKFER